jgi:hypothetical protein
MLTELWPAEISAPDEIGLAPGPTATAALTLEQGGVAVAPAPFDAQVAALFPVECAGAASACLWDMSRMIPKGQQTPPPSFRGSRFTSNSGH